MLTNLLWIQKASDSCGAQLRQCQIKLCFFICAWISKTFFQRAKIFFSCFFFSFCFWNQQTPWKLKISTIVFIFELLAMTASTLKIGKAPMRTCTYLCTKYICIYVHMWCSSKSSFLFETLFQTATLLIRRVCFCSSYYYTISMKFFFFF